MEQTMRLPSTDKTCVMFNKEFDDEALCWNCVGERYEMIPIISYKGHRYAVPLFSLPEDRQQCFEKIFPDHYKILITEGVNKNFVGYFKIRSAKYDDPRNPCDHPGCLNHASHPCEKCGRIFEDIIKLENNTDKWKKLGEVMAKDIYAEVERNRARPLEDRIKEAIRESIEGGKDDC